MADLKSISVIPSPSTQKVLLITDGKLVAEMPVEAALQISKLLVSAAKVVENEANPVALVAAQKEMIQMGLPIAMSMNPKVIARANHELKNEGGSFSCGYKGVVSSPTISGGD